MCIGFLQTCIPDEKKRASCSIAPCCCHAEHTNPAWILTWPVEQPSRPAFCQTYAVASASECYCYFAVSNMPPLAASSQKLCACVTILPCGHLCRWVASWLIDCRRKRARQLPRQGGMWRGVASTYDVGFFSYVHTALSAIRAGCGEVWAGLSTPDGDGNSDRDMSNCTVECRSSATTQVSQEELQ
eukprot:213604-Chlamydomonas_euryale.AAC.27